MIEGCLGRGGVGLRMRGLICVSHRYSVSEMVAIRPKWLRSWEPVYDNERVLIVKSCWTRQLADADVGI